VDGEVVNTTGGLIDVNLAAVNNSTSGVAAFSRAINAITIGTANSGCTASGIIPASLVPAAAVADQFRGLILAFDKLTTTSGLRGQKTDITASTISGILTVTALASIPQFGDTFVIE
jgi:hypothetical protein